MALKRPALRLGANYFRTMKQVEKYKMPLSDYDIRAAYNNYDLTFKQAEEFLTELGMTPAEVVELMTSPVLTSCDGEYNSDQWEEYEAYMQDFPSDTL